MDVTEATALLTKGHRGWLALSARENVPLSSISASTQGVLRKDVLDFYLTQPQETFEDQPSSGGAQGPLTVELSDSRTVLVDGSHRWAAAKVRLEPSFLARYCEGKQAPNADFPCAERGIPFCYSRKPIMAIL